MHTPDDDESSELEKRIDEIVAAGPRAPSRWPASRPSSWSRCSSCFICWSICRGGRSMTTAAHDASRVRSRRRSRPSGAGPSSSALSSRSLLAMMVFTGLHWAAMPPSRVETVDVKTLHLKGEFVENNLGTAIDKDGRVIVRLIAQQYSFAPQCIVVPAGDAGDLPRHQHRRHPRLRRRPDQRQHHADSRLRLDLHHDLPQDRRAADALSRILRHRPRSHVGQASR